MASDSIKRFRKLTPAQRRQVLAEHLGIEPAEFEAVECRDEIMELADVLVESAIGVFPVPLGIATGFLIDGQQYFIPMATKEPSVIAAASYGARIIAAAGGFHTWADDPVMTAQVYLQEVPHGREWELQRMSEELDQRIRKILPSLYRRGGGFRSLEVTRLPETDLVRLHIHIDVRDAMGANMVNTTAEGLKPYLEELTSGRVLMNILTNSAPMRRAGAGFSVPLSSLARAGLSGSEVGERLELASRLANEDPARAATHNKGIMNGITALTLATANDTRGVEAAAHSYATRHGHYTSLSHFHVKGECLEGRLELPIPLGTVGGAVGFHPTSRLSLRILGNPEAVQLSRIAAALGLAQNFAALFALVSEGIQHGHMRLHASRVAWMAGARGNDIPKIAAAMWKSGKISIQEAERMLERGTKEHDHG